MKIIIEEDGRKGHEEMGEVVQCLFANFPKIDVETHLIMKLEGGK